MQFIINDQFCDACLSGDIMVAKKLLHDNPHINISVRDEEPFRNACRYGHLEIAKWLLQIRPQIDISVYDEGLFKKCLSEWLFKTCQIAVRISTSGKYFCTK